MNQTHYLKSPRLMSKLAFSFRVGFLLVRIGITLCADYRPDPNVYHTVDRYNKEVKEFATKYPDIVVVEQTAFSRNNEPLFLLRLTDPAVSPPNGQEKLKILITFGEHAREYLPVESFFK